MKLRHPRALALRPAVLALLAATAAPQGDPPCELTELTSFAANLPGGEIALDGDTLAFAGTPGNVFVYVESGGTWSEEQHLAVPNTARGLALEGDTLLVGMAANDDVEVDAGKVEVYERSGTTWSLAQELYPDAPVAGDLFGAAVALQGDLALVGCTGRGAGGRVFVFKKRGGTWTKVTELEPLVPEASAYFGASISISGDTALIAKVAGNAYAFVETAGTWSQQAELDLPVTQLDGVSVDTALDGDLAVVGQRHGGVEFFARSGTSWHEEGSIELVGGFTTPATFVALDGEVAVVTDDGGPSIWVRGDGTWTELAVLLPPAPSTFDRVSVAIEGTRVVAALHSAPTRRIREYEVPAFVAPSVTFRNAGTNPSSYTSTPAYVGQSLHLTVDLTTTGHAMALVIGFDSPFGLTLAGGQTLLCLDLMGSGGELINTGFHPGPIAEIDLRVPNDLAFAGFSVCTQTVHAFGVAPFALSNAQDIVLGACF